MIRTAAVLGAGTMGAQLAAHCANAGLEVIVFDRTRAEASAGLARLSALRPQPLFLPEVAGRLRAAGLDELEAIRRVDWVVEAVVESLAVKRELMARIEPLLGTAAIASSNTSAIPLHEIVQGCGASLRRRFLGTHFFNPPRYQRLVELVPTADTDTEVAAELQDFLDRRLGKGVVVARDTPGFIANRIGLFGALRALEAWASGAFTLEEIEALTGPATGGPRSATFRTIDLVGLDVLAAVAADLSHRLPGEGFDLPDVVHRMIERGFTGARAGQGFYKRVTGEGRGATLVLDPATLEYRPHQVSSSPPGEWAADDPADRIRRLLSGDDRTSELLRRTLGATLLYAARVAPEIADSIDDIDRAMRWGFGWRIGPFEMWDALGHGTVLDALQPAAPPRLIQTAIDDGRAALRTAPLPPAGPGLLVLTSARRSGGVVRANAAASLIDLGDGVFAVELHAKLNILGRGTLEMLHAGVEHAAAHGLALVVASEAEQFSAGADLRLILEPARSGRWEDLDDLVRGFQTAMMTIKTAPVPVIAAPAGHTLGGGCELCLHADRIQAAAETYIGLPETGLGLIPAGGGTKEMLLRAMAAADARAAVAAAFQTIALASVSTSALDARRLGYLADRDGIVMNRERVVAAAKEAAIARAAAGVAPPAPLDAIPVGGASTLAALLRGIDAARAAGQIGDHDALVGRALARVFAGGDLPRPGTVSEQRLLDLERDAFLSLCGEAKTQERIAYTLKTGKALRN